MANLNPMVLLNLLKNGNPQEVAMQLIQTRYPNDPTMLSLIEMGQRGDIQGLQQFAQQMFAREGRDFNQEMNNFMSALKQMGAN